MKTTFTTTVLKDSESSATGLQAPDEVVAALGKGKKPPVKLHLICRPVRISDCRQDNFTRGGKVWREPRVNR
jgi:hypothetical protein